jgi:predicted AlkP superfamily phosphohydrolase/phosphomutase
VIVSDHGFRALPYPYTSVQINKLLAELGFLRFNAEGEIDFAASTAYSSGSDGSYPELCVNLNIIGREPHGIAKLASGQALKRHVAEQLKAITFKDSGSPVFHSVLVNDNHSFPEQFTDCDLLVGLTAESKQPSERIVRVGETEKPYADYLQINPLMTGTHDNYGIIIIRSSGVRPGPFLFQRSLDTPLGFALAFLNGRIKTLDPIITLCQWIGMLPAASTLDITPTVLELMGLPLAEDMDGRPIFRVAKPPQRVPSYDHLLADHAGNIGSSNPQESEEGSTPRKGNSVVDESVRERLRALGYIQ